MHFISIFFGVVSLLVIPFRTLPDADIELNIPSDVFTTVDQEDPPDPCEILSESVLRKFFAIETELTHVPSKYSRHPLCTVNWDKPNAREIEEANNANMLEIMQAKIRGEEPEHKIQKTINSVHLTINAPLHETVEDAARAYASALAYLQKDNSVEVDGKTYTSKAREVVPLQGIGDQAAWVPSLNQITVQSGRCLFHVGVEIGEHEKNLEKARALTLELIRTVEEFQ